MNKRSVLLALLCVLLLGVIPGYAEDLDDDDDAPAIKAGAGSGSASGAASPAEKKDPAKTFEAWVAKTTKWIDEATAKLNDKKLNGKQKEKMLADVAKRIENLKKRKEKIDAQIKSLQAQGPVVTDLQGKMTALDGKVKTYVPVEKPADAKDAKDAKDAPKAPDAKPN